MNQNLGRACCPNMGRSLSSATNLLHAVSANEEIESCGDNIIIDEITEVEPTSVILKYCKRRFLRPYVCILGLVGLRPNAVDVDLGTLLGHLHSIIVLLLLLGGYVLQYLSGFRRDRGFLEPELPAVDPQSNGSGTTSPAVSDATTIKPSIGTIMRAALANGGEGIFSHIIPAMLHLGGYVIAVYIYRFADNEHLQCLIERVFILSSAPRRLVATLWVYFVLGVLWLSCSTAYNCLMLEEQSQAITHLKWTGDLNPTGRDCVRGLLCLALFLNDLVQTVIIISYSLTCYLLRCYLQGLKEKLLLHTIEPLNWMREICEFRKLLHHLNRKISIPVCCLTLVNLSYTFSSIVHLFRDMNTCPVKMFSFTAANLLLWIIISLTPFYQYYPFQFHMLYACRVGGCCGLPEIM
ncbi:uncharacterized protein LOC129724603 isoform X2 [Wyeomyia smithii]|uniref:uncharacterized protein LOC129724603 isoform X2 n=1 Tax=Wyeomyia smithii TaxID=174621 RepID=UPI002468027E|nr:uncharacterized protein LOC129724603 isoform X2 [Wyeomyia smithii]